MQSKITIEVDFENGNEPVIQIISRPTDDVRDKLIQFFFSKLSNTSSWCRVWCGGDGNNGADKFTLWRIRPITTTELKQEAEIMAEQYRIIEEHNKKTVHSQ
jgi:hypothetical protein